MYIEPGHLSQTTLWFANAAVLGVLAYYARALLQRPGELPRVGIAAVIFAIFMLSSQVSFGLLHLQITGAMALYLTLGLLPALFGMAAGVLLQGWVFEPAAPTHFAVNALSLMLPLLMVHYTLGRRLATMTYGHHLSRGLILKLNVWYGGGAAALTAVWLLISGPAMAFAAWPAFALSSFIVVALEFALTITAIRVLKRFQHIRWVDACFAVKPLRLVS